MATYGGTEDNVDRVRIAKYGFTAGGGGGSSRMIPASGFVHNAHFLLMISASSGI